MRNIPFTQYVLPNGRKKEVFIERPDNIVDLAEKFMESGGRFEVEILMNGVVSLTAVKDIDGEPEDIEIQLCQNGPGMDEAVDKLILSVSK